MGGADRVEGVGAVGPGKEAEGEQKREGAEARHHQIDIARAQILAHMIVRHHQRPGRQRHELPGEEKGEGVVGDDDEGHGGEEQRVEGQHALRRRLVAAEAERIKARGGAAEIDHHEKERRERVQAEMGAEPGKPDRQDRSLGRGLTKQSCEPGHETDAAKGERSSVDEGATECASCSEKRQGRQGNEGRDGDEDDGERHRLAHKGRRSGPSGLRLVPAGYRGQSLV